MSRKLKLFVAAGVLVLIGVALLAWSPSKPEPECAEPGAPSSGFVDSDSGCAITDASYQKIRDAESGVKWDNVGGLALIAVGLGVAGVTVFRKPKKPSR
jgi:hypothetical protein